MKKYYSFIFLFIVYTQCLFAQFESAIEVSSYYDDNLYRSPSNTMDFLTDFNLYLGYNFLDEKMTVFYTPDYFKYSESTDHSFIYHSFGLSYTNSFNEDMHYLYAGATMDIRSNQEVFDYLNYSQFYGYVNARFDLEHLFLKTGYNVRLRNYANLSELSNIQHYFFAQFNRSFSSGTSLIFEVDYGLKSFSGSESFISTDTVALSGGGHGQGPGSGGGADYIQTLEPLDLSHVVLLFRAAQSLHPKVGINVQYRLQKDLSQSGAYSSGGFYFQDEEIFDDPFSYESQAFSSQLTWILPWSMQLKAGGSFNQKDYISERAYISAEDTVGAGGLRYDERASLFSELSKSFYPAKSGMKNIQISLNWSWVRNRSNSYWYDYKNMLLGGAIRWSF